MRKKIIIICAVIVAIFIILLAWTDMFTKDVLTGILYRVDNVYEEIWNLLNLEQKGVRTVLSTKMGGECHYDHGSFMGLSISVNNEYRIYLSFYGGEMEIHFYEYNSESRKYINYIYNYQSNTLYGNCEESYLFANFTALYFSWVQNYDRFNPANCGNYTFVLTEYPSSHK